MDLLGNYGSDAESDASEEEETQQKNAGRAVFIAPGASTNHSEARSKPESKAGVSRTGLFASLPPPRSKGNGLEEDSVGKESSGSLFAKLPAPKATSGRQSLADLQSDLGLGGMMPLATVVPPKKGVVQFRPPIDTSYLSKDDDDDAWQPPKKKGRKADPPEGGAAEKPSKSSFASFLPPPKNSLGAGNILGGGASGGRKMAMDTAAALEERPRIELDTNEVATPSGRGAPPAGVSSAAVERDSNRGVAEELPLDSVYPPPVEINVGYQSQVDYSHPSNAYLHSGQVGNSQPAAYNPSAQPYPAQSQTYTAPVYQAQFSAQANVWQPDGAMNEAQAGQPMDLLTAKLMEEEGRRMRRGGAQGPQLVEVKQADITSGTYRREDMLKSGASTFGPQAQPVSSAKDAGPKKLERRKHQISSLYADMKKKEMEMMDSRATGMQTKAQTKGKYGW